MAIGEVHLTKFTFSNEKTTLIGHVICKIVQPSWKIGPLMLKYRLFAEVTDLDLDIIYNPNSL